MILDDPTSSLDNKVTADILEIITKHRKWKEKTFIISTKKLSVLDYMDDAIFLRNGSVLYSGGKEGLKSLPDFQELKILQKENQVKQEKTLDEINAEYDQDINAGVRSHDKPFFN